MVLFCNCECVVRPAMVSSMIGKMGCFDFTDSLLIFFIWFKLESRSSIKLVRTVSTTCWHCSMSSSPSRFLWLESVPSNISMESSMVNSASPSVLRKLRISWVKMLSWRRSFIIVSRSLRMRLDKVRMMERSAWGSDAR